MAEPRKQGKKAMSNCGTCGAEIVWAITEAGKRMPLDAKPEKRFVVDDADGCHLVDTYVSHFSTCPNAEQHRRAR